ncbi:MAG: flagellar biosynthesis protein FlhA [Heliobacteriaceae bacterium]|jgi:flagellar biosynthesis protein FlhA|nr:flagellar biosynthesis protein FlhA [Heliobacteriaceae bacterium]
MFRKNKMQYVIKTVPCDNTEELQNLLNEMSVNGWELYSMHETETDEGIMCSCIFMSEMPDAAGDKNADIINISTFRSQMEKMLSPELNPYEICLDIQAKINEQQKKITKIKTELEDNSSASRKRLNERISAELNELEELKRKLAAATSPDTMYPKLNGEKLAICLSEEILSCNNQENNLHDLIAQTVKSRLKLTEELGFVIPKILFCDDENLNPFEFSIRIRGTDVLKAQAYPGYIMFEELRLEKKIKNSIYDVDSITGKKIIWIEKDKTKSFWQKGLSDAEYIAKALEYAAVKYADELLDYQELEKYIAVVSSKNPSLVENIIPDFISLADLRFIMTGLIREKVSIRDISYIFEKINDYAEENVRFDLLNKIRLSLSRRICRQHANEDGVITAFEISEKTLSSLVFDGDDIVRIDANYAEKLVSKLEKKAKQAEISCIKLIAPMELRQLLFIMLSQYMPDITVLCREETGCNCQLEIIGEV